MHYTTALLMLLLLILAAVVVWVLIVPLRDVFPPACQKSRRDGLARFSGEGGVGRGVAVVTGASAGIGRGIALELARCGMDLLLVARREADLHTLEREIKTNCQGKCDVTVLAADLATQEGRDSVVSAAAGLNISMLVNNAGVCNLMPEECWAVAEGLTKAEVALNVEAVTDLTLRLLPKLRERRSSAILFMGSANGLLPCPQYGVYSASKAYVHTFSQCLWAELYGTGVEIFTLAPFWVSTGMTLTNKETTMFISPVRFAAGAMAYIARHRGGSPRPVTTYYWHGVLRQAMGMLPNRWRLVRQQAQMIAKRGPIRAKMERMSGGK